MEEARAVHTNEEEEVGDDFYEKIEAPKFVDFTAPDHYHPDDSYWFCLRVGCDKKHEEEWDFEAINKNFVLRVMAARSPNIRLRKVLNTKGSSANLKCPLTVPAKSSRSRMSRLAMISSMSHKAIDDKLKARPVVKTCSVATPKAKVKQSSLVAKALTTPRNPKRILNPDKFSSVQNPKPTGIMVPKKRVVAKALFHSPKKVKTKYSKEMSTPVKSLCSAMKRLEMTGGNKNLEGFNKKLPTASSRKQLKGREVRSRVFDSLNSHRSKVQEGNSSRCLSEKKRVKGSSQKPGCLQPPQKFENDLSDMEVNEKSRNGSLERRIEYGPSPKPNEGATETCMKATELSVGEYTTDVSSDLSRVEGTSTRSSEANDASKSQSLAEAGNKASDESKKMEEDNHRLDKLRSPEALEDYDKENDSFSDDKENICKAHENEDKENRSACKDERKSNVRKNCEKTTPPIKDECLKAIKNSAFAAIGSQVAKYRKPKPTNPKPFKLRTDERGILRGANMEKKLLRSSRKRNTTSFLKKGQALKRHREMREVNQNHIGQSEQNTIIHGCKERTEDKKRGNEMGIIQHTPLKFARRTVSECKKQKQKGVCQEKVGKNWEDDLRRRSPVTEPKIAWPRGDMSTRKENTPFRTPSQLTVIEESSSKVLGPGEAAGLCHNGVLCEIQATSVTSQSSSRGKSHTTVPKEPLFHRAAPKSCCARKRT